MIPSKIKSLFFEKYSHWGIGIVNEPISVFLKRKPKVKWLSPKTKEFFWADPFGIYFKKKLYIFAEHYDHKFKKGEIVCLDGSEMSRVLKSPVHCSYPYLIQSEKSIFCLPESNMANEAVLYEAEDFPNKWRVASVLVKGERVVDPTLFFHKGYWWLFYTRGEDPHRALYAQYSKKLTGPYIPHALNPLKKDSGSSRPAGTPFVHEGVLYRPAQDCRKSYGGGIVINKILSLTPKTFNEKIVKTIEPYNNSPYPDGIHTLSQVGDRTLVDGKRNLYRLRGPWAILKILKRALWR